MTEQQIQKEIAEERRQVKEYVKNNKYQSYKQMTDKLENHIQLWAEYGQRHHICCKIIYENPFDEDLIVKMGKEIYKMGGFHALQMNHAIIKYFSPYGTSDNINVRSMGGLIEMYFEKVTPEWKK
jgi:hypothetical protein